MLDKSNSNGSGTDSQKPMEKYKEHKLSQKTRSHLAPATFGLPGSRAYPMPDKAHARAAEMDAGIEAARGKLSETDKAKIDAKARKVLGSK